MSYDYARIAKEVIQAVGGPENIRSATHCATRLRLIVADRAKADDEKVGEIEGVKGTFFTAGQYQIIFGTGHVNRVYEQVVRLGIADQNGRIYDKKQDKFRQINRFLECLDDLSAYFPKDQPVRAVDFGCGKSYLTFAMHYYFTVHKGLETDIIGLDLKEDVISFCSRTVEELGLKGIHFLKGDISQFAPIKDADLTVSLHACDTATDAALAQAIASRSRLILSVPCCHHELARQIECPPLEGITRFGVLNHRLADIATDALRAAHLEAAGYQVQVFEFIEAEHTPKNLMMRAVLKNPAGNKEAYKKYCELRDFFRVSPAIERLARLPEGIQPVQ